jgi:hypothetical protein
MSSRTLKAPSRTNVLSNNPIILDYAKRTRKRYTVPLWLDIILFAMSLLLTNAFFLALLVMTSYGIFLILQRV